VTVGERNLTINPRERALTAIHHREAYPVPVDLFENGIYPALQADLARHYGLVEDDLEQLMQRLGAAFRWARPVYTGPPPEVDLTREPGYPHRVTHVNIWDLVGSQQLFGPVAQPAGDGRNRGRYRGAPLARSGLVRL
jgi:hypothetical protein